MKIYCRNPVLMHCAPPPRTAPHRTVMDVPRCGVVPSGPSRVSVPRHGHGRARARIRTRAQSRERGRESLSERGRHSRRERSFVVCPPCACRYLPLSSSSTKSRWCHAAMLSATPPDEKEERQRGRETEIAETRSRKERRRVSVPRGNGL